MNRTSLHRGWSIRRLASLFPAPVFGWKTIGREISSWANRVVLVAAASSAPLAWAQEPLPPSTSRGDSISAPAEPPVAPAAAVAPNIGAPPGPSQEPHTPRAASQPKVSDLPIPPGEVEEVIITANRTAKPRKEVPSAVQVIGEQELATTPGDALPEVLKKTSGMDVIQYPGILSGVGIRGFRPEYDGITKHYVVLIDGLPAGATNIATILKDDVTRIEVLKGPASALYGAEAMGGVVNVITRRSTGDPAHRVALGGGSFGAHREAVSSGGALSPWLDYDASFNNRGQLDDYRMGNGLVRHWTSFEEGQAALRLGSSLASEWRVDLKGTWYMGRNIQSPGALHDADTTRTTKNIDRPVGTLTLSKTWGRHHIRAALYASQEGQEYTNHYTDRPVYKSYYSKNRWLGAQLQDAYAFSRHDVTLGLDFQRISVESNRWSSSGERIAPYVPDNGRENLALFLDGTFRVLEGNLVLNAGLRFDTFKISAEETPYLPGAAIGSSHFRRLSPRAGVKYFLTRDHSLQIRSTIGTAFVPPSITNTVIYHEAMVSGVAMITQGNPHLGPEWSLTGDAGVTLQLGSSLQVDFTYFETRVHDRITKSKLSDTVTTYVNANSATTRGLEAQVTWDAGAALRWGRKLQLFANTTWLPQNRETLTSEGALVTRDIYNVAKIRYAAGADYDDDTFFGRLAARYVGARKDNDWYTPGYPEISFGPFVVCDLSLGARFLKHHTFTLSIENIFDKHHFEKPEYPLPGRSIHGAYSLAL
jgi:vitamin B12 transporter